MFFWNSCFVDDPADVGNLTSGSYTFSKTSLNIWLEVKQRADFTILDTSYLYSNCIAFHSSSHLFTLLLYKYRYPITAKACLNGSLKVSQKQKSRTSKKPIEQTGTGIVNTDVTPTAEDKPLFPLPCMHLEISCQSHCMT